LDLNHASLRHFAELPDKCGLSVGQQAPEWFETVLHVQYDRLLNYSTWMHTLKLLLFVKQMMMVSTRTLSSSPLGT
jgi:hypothetical protein